MNDDLDFTPPDLIAVDRALGKASLCDYVAMAWPVLFPDAKFKPSWSLDAICEHLEAVERDEIDDLLITAPPRQGKSNTITVLYPTWAWLRRPSLSWIFDSNKMTLTLRDALRRRQLMESAWFRERFGEVFYIIPEQHAKSRVENDHRGAMIATSVDTSIIGEGGDRIVADDLHDPADIDTPDTIAGVVSHWTQQMSTRKNKGAKRILTQQRIGDGDVAGDCIERGYVHLNLSQEFDPEHVCVTRWFRDPRTEAGELLNPALFDEKQNADAKATLDEFHYAAQHQQDPIPAGGGVFKEEWCQRTYIKVPTRFDRIVLSLDCTFKDKKSSDYVAGLVWASLGVDVYLLPWAIHDKLSFTKTIDSVRDFCAGHPDIKEKLVEDKANGTAVVDMLKSEIKGFIPWDPGSDSKIARARAVSYRFRAGNIVLPHASICGWIKKYLIELTRFPGMTHDDYVDSTTMALLYFEDNVPVNQDVSGVSVERDTPGSASPWSF